LAALSFSSTRKPSEGTGTESECPTKTKIVVYIISLLGLSLSPRKGMKRAGILVFHSLLPKEEFHPLLSFLKEEQNFFWSHCIWLAQQARSKLNFVL